MYAPIQKCWRGGMCTDYRGVSPPSPAYESLVTYGNLLALGFTWNIGHGWGTCQPRPSCTSPRVHPLVYIPSCVPPCVHRIQGPPLDRGGPPPPLATASSSRLLSPPLPIAIYRHLSPPIATASTTSRLHRHLSPAPLATYRHLSPPPLPGNSQELVYLPPLSEGSSLTR